MNFGRDLYEGQGGIDTTRRTFGRRGDASIGKGPIALRFFTCLDERDLIDGAEIEIAAAAVDGESHGPSFGALSVDFEVESTVVAIPSGLID